MLQRTHTAGNSGQSASRYKGKYTGDTPALESQHIPDSPDRKVRLLSFENLDKRYSATRCVLALESQIHDDLGGADFLSVAQFTLARRAAVLSAVIEHEEARWCAGEEIDLPLVLSAINCLRRVFGVLGMKRQAKQVGVSELLARRASERT